eukprot:3686711-Alexandrium_andersonii.AAC.1
MAMAMARAMPEMATKLATEAMAMAMETVATVAMATVVMVVAVAMLTKTVKATTRCLRLWNQESRGSTAVRAAMCDAQREGW